MSILQNIIMLYVIDFVTIHLAFYNINLTLLWFHVKNYIPPIETRSSSSS